ncbi:unnamed protein product, partial [Staurois parvus]
GTESQVRQRALSQLARQLAGTGSGTGSFWINSGHRVQLALIGSSGWISFTMLGRGCIRLDAGVRLSRGFMLSTGIRLSQGIRLSRGFS